MSLGAGFLTGQAARLVVGQTSFTSQISGASDKLLGAAGGLAFANGRLFIADSNRLGLTPLNNRVLIMDTATFPKPLDPIPAFISTCAVCVGTASVVVGQDDFTSTGFAAQANRLREATAVASDGVRLAVADTRNNRVLLWNTIPTTNGAPADVVLGQPNFTTVKQLQPGVVDGKTLRAPQGVWFQNGKLFVADTQNYRVLIWNSIPTQNEQSPDLVIGQPNFNTAIEPVVTAPEPRADRLLNPVSVTSDGQRMYVADLGHNRVLIWNSIPTQNAQPADVVIGQKDFTTAIANDSPGLCNPADENEDGEPDKDEDGDLIYPIRCAKTLNFPRYALSDGRRLFVADGGNDRVLIFNQIPTQNAPAADLILGQANEFESAVSSATDLFHPLLRQSAADLWDPLESTCRHASLSIL